MIVGATIGTIGAVSTAFIIDNLTYATYPTVPVPEPATYGMLLAGLATLGMIGRRRKAV